MMWLILSGFLAGVIGGMGMGGGIILIPVLTLMLGFSQHAAQGMTLFFFIPTAVFALWVHIKNKNLEFKTAVPLIIGGVIGATIGAYFSKSVSQDILKIAFSILLVISAIYEFKIALTNKRGDDKMKKKN